MRPTYKMEGGSKVLRHLNNQAMFQEESTNTSNVNAYLERKTYLGNGVTLPLGRQTWHWVSGSVPKYLSATLTCCPYGGRRNGVCVWPPPSEEDVDESPNPEGNIKGTAHPERPQRDSCLPGTCAKIAERVKLGTPGALPTCHLRGECIDDVSMPFCYKCINCREGFGNGPALNCEVDTVDNCNPDPCNGHGSCAEHPWIFVNGHQCTCDPEWKGPNCEFSTSPTHNSSVHTPTTDHRRHHCQPA